MEKENIDLYTLLNINRNATKEEIVNIVNFRKKLTKF
jgi:hypothetical protein